MTSLSVSVETIFEPARLAVAEGRIPGATLGLVTAKGERSVLTAGLAQREPESIPLHRTHWFDLASLTKVIFTTDNLIRLVEQGRVGAADVEHRRREVLHANATREEQQVAGLRGGRQRDGDRGGVGRCGCCHGEIGGIPAADSLHGPRLTGVTASKYDMSRSFTQAT